MEWRPQWRPNWNIYDTNGNESWYFYSMVSQEPLGFEFAQVIAIEVAPVDIIYSRSWNG